MVDISWNLIGPEILIAFDNLLVVFFWVSSPCNAWMFRYFSGMYCLYLQGDSLVQVDAEADVGRKECMGKLEEIWPVWAMEVEDWPKLFPTFPYTWHIPHSPVELTSLITSLKGPNKLCHRKECCCKQGVC